MGSPLELIRYDPVSGRFEAGEEALRALERVQGPVGVVAVSGRARQGKSYILNQILGRSSGFKVSPTHKTCTKGLWLWSAPIERTTIDGQRYNLVLLDTEGIVAYDQTGQYSTQIFCLAVLLSSLFIFNQMGGIDEDSLDQLSLVTEMSKHIKIRANTDQDSVNDLSQFTPSFIWLLRDFYLRLEEGDKRKITPKEYLELALKSIPGDSSAAQAKNQIRESIKGLFPDRECITLVRPVTEESDLANLESLPKHRLRSEFRTGVDQLMNLIWQKAKIKMIGNGIVNGPRLAALTRMYVQAINDGAVPTIATAWQGVEEQECRRAAEEAEKAYKQTFQEEILGDEATLEQEHARAMLVAQQVFDSIALGNGQAKEAGERKFREVLQWRFEQFRDRRIAEAEQQIDQRLYNQTIRMQQISRTEGITIDQLNTEIDEFLMDYDDNTVGPSKWPKLLEFMRNVYSVTLYDLTQREVIVLKKKLESASQFEQQFQGLQTQAERQKQLFIEEKNQLQEQFRKLQEQLTGSQAQLQTAVVRQKDLEKQLEDVLYQKGLGISNARKEAENRVRELMGEQQQRVQQSDFELTQKQNMIDDLQQRLASQQKIVQDAQQDNNNRQQVLAQQLQIKDAQLERVKQEMQSQIDDLEGLRRNTETYVEKLRQDQQSLQEALQREQEKARQALEENNRLREQYEQQLRENRNIDNVRVNPAKMTIQEISDWLNSRGFQGEVWDLSNKRAKKQEWVDMMNSKQ